MSQNEIEPVGLSVEQKRLMEVNEFTEGFQLRIESLKDMSDEALGAMYQESSLITNNLFKLECAILWEVHRRAPKDHKKKYLGEFAEDIGIDLRTAQRKVQEWEVFFQDENFECAKQRDAGYAFDTLRSPEIWFRTAIQAGEGDKKKCVEALRKAEEKFEEAKCTNKPYTVNDMKEDLGIKPKSMPGNLPCPCKNITRNISVLASIGGKSLSIPLAQFMKSYFIDGIDEDVIVADLRCKCGISLLSEE